MSARQKTYTITGLPPLGMAKEAIEQFAQAWQQRNAAKLKSVFIDRAISQSLQRVCRDERVESRNKPVRRTGPDQVILRFYRDPKTNVIFEVNVVRRVITAVRADGDSKPMLHNPQVGFVIVTDHAAKRFEERYLGRLKGRKPKAFDAQEMLWESFGRAKPTVPKNADQRLVNNEGRPAIYLLDALIGLRYVIHKKKLVLLTVEIPDEK